MIDYKSNIKDALLKILILNFVFFALIFFDIKNINWGLVLLFSLVILFQISIFFIRKRLILLRINEVDNTIILVFRKYLFNQYSEKLKFKELTFSYKDEVGARGVKTQEFRIYSKGTQFFGISGAFDGWPEKTIMEMVLKLRELGLDEIK